MFVAEYENVNVTGEPTKALILAAEITSCAKRTLARYAVVTTVQYIYSHSSNYCLVLIAECWW